MKKNIINKEIRVNPSHFKFFFSFVNTNLSKKILNTAIKYIIQKKVAKS